ncbi:hypothetical protein ABK040_015591 [Willaertia magna]
MKNLNSTLLLSLLLIISFVVGISFQQHNGNGGVYINEVSVLIPWKSDGIILKASTDMQITKGQSNCFYWTTLNPDLVSLIPVQDESSSVFQNSFDGFSCSQQVQVVPKGFNPQKKVAIVIASLTPQNSLNNGATAQCEVFIDQIHELKLQTTIRKLVVNELETLQVDAFDSEGNIFSSLAGIKFDWRSASLSIANNRVGSIQLLDIRDKSVKMLTERNAGRRGINNLGRQWDLIVAKGINVGEASITVSTISEDSSKTLSDTVQFYILDNFILEPSPLLRVIPGTIIPYKLYRNTEHVVMPDKLYSWSSTNTTVGEIDERTGVFKAIDFGITNVVVSDTTFPINQAKGLVYVVRPTHLKLKITPLQQKLYKGYESILMRYSNSNNIQHSSLVLGNDYRINVELYDDTNSLIYISDNVKFQFDIDAKQGLIQILEKSESGDSYTIRATALGDAIIRVSLNTATMYTHFDQTFSTHNEDIELSHAKPISIDPRVKMDFPNDVIYLPIDYNVKQDYKVKASGGSGELIWSGLNVNSVIDVHEKSGMIVTKAEGEAELIVFDINNLFNGDSRTVSVSVPSIIQFVPGLREVSIEENLCLEVQGRDSRGNTFASISALPLEWNIADSSVYEMARDNTVCTPSHFGSETKVLFGITEGFTTVRFKYLSGKLQDRAFVAVYPKLFISEPYSMSPSGDSKIFLIPLGATATLTVQGGPQPWDRFIKGESIITDTLEVEDQEKLKLTKEPSHYNQEYRVRSYSLTCSDFSEQLLNLTIRHDIPVEGALSTLATLPIAYACKKPETMRLAPLNPSNNEELSSISTTGNLRVFSVRNNQTVPVRMNVYDADGNKFVSVSSLVDTWKLSDEQLATFASQKPGYRTLDIADKVGFLIISGTIEGYIRDILKKHVSYNVMNKAISQFTKEITDQVELRITSNVYVNPAKYLLFKDRRLSVTLKAAGGSGKYDYSSNDTQVISLSPRGNEVEASPTNFGFVKVNAIDTLFTTSPPGESLIRVADVNRITIEGEHYIQEGNSIPITLKIFDDLGSLFPSEQYFAMQPKIEADKPGIVVIRASNDTTDQSIFSVFGVSPGTIKLIASAFNSEGRRIFSNPLIVTVYGPLIVDPPELVLIPAASYQLKLIGGPPESHNVKTVFTIKNERNEKNPIATVDQRGVVTGNTYGEVSLLVERKSALNDFVYESKTVPVLVVQLTGIRLTPNLNVFINNYIPVPVYGVYGNDRLLSPLFMQSQYFKVVLESQEATIAQIQQPYSTTGHSAFISGNKIGKTRIIASAAFNNHPFLPNLSFSTGSEIQVDEKLKLLDFPHKDLILAPKSSSFILKTNKDNVSLQKYITTKTDEYENVVVVDRNGRVNTGNNEGISVVVVEEVVSGQTVAQKIAVQNPHYLALNLEGSFDYNFKIPLGSDFEIPLFAFNNRGDKFVSINGIDLNVRMNYQDVITAKISTDSQAIILFAHSVGNVTLEISAPETRESYYCRISVVSAIEPLSSASKLHVGDAVRFDISRQYSSITGTGYWESEDETILQVDPKAAKGVALRPGSTRVFFKTSRLSTHMKIEVVKISFAKLAVNSITLSATTDPSSQSVVRVPLILIDQNNQEMLFETDPRVERNVDIDCLSTSHYIEVIGTEKRGNRYECLIKPSKQAYNSGELSQLQDKQHDIYFNVRITHGEAKESKQYTLSTATVPVSFSSSGISGVDGQQPSETPGNFSTYVILSLLAGVLGFIVFQSITSATPQAPSAFPTGKQGLTRNIEMEGQENLLDEQEVELPPRSKRFTHHYNSKFESRRNMGGIYQQQPHYVNPYYVYDSDQE